MFLQVYLVESWLFSSISILSRCSFLIHEKLGFEYPAPVAKSYQWQILNLFLYTSINPVHNDFFYV